MVLLWMIYLFEMVFCPTCVELPEGENIVAMGLLYEPCLLYANCWYVLVHDKFTS